MIAPIILLILIEGGSIFYALNRLHESDIEIVGTPDTEPDYYEWLEGQGLEYDYLEDEQIMKKGVYVQDEPR
jgi:hypothetical protein